MDVVHRVLADPVGAVFAVERRLRRELCVLERGRRRRRSSASIRARRGR
ncbi:MAG: hypothetical protein MZV70_49885 [Desulfobacterales bacterium]|nr:hypothetical protein [Desulfobacterales bacterium]